ncbi:hypothetical protein [Fulvimarina sp. MAC3]|uniref:hypothetical protein n=1 Tax=Fulvimarina sp. MAC3 TaxID=3148887 RepID=UPI0031FD8790
MLVLLSFLAGIWKDWWWVPASAGLVGQIAHYVGSPGYRYTLRTVDGALLTALVSMLALTGIAFAAFAAGGWLADLL